MLEVGGTVGRYRILRTLESGIAGTSFLARDAGGDRDVVLTVYAADLDWGDARDRFAAEAGRLVLLRHAHLVPVEAYGEHQARPYIVAEHVRGMPLSAAVAREHGHSLTERLEWMEALCAAIGHAHEQGIVHGALTPASVVVDAGGRIHVSHAGIGPMLRALGADAIAAQVPGYAAPEVARGGDPDARADVFSIGAIGFELLAGVPPFGRGAADAIADRLLHSEPGPLPGIDRDLAAVILTALNKEASARFPTTRALGDALASWRARGHPIATLGTAMPDATRVARPDPGSRDLIDELVSESRAGGGEVPPPVVTPVGDALQEAVPRALDENVQFTVFRPNTIVPATWHTMLVFAHLSERRSGAPPGEPDPVQEVRRQAEALLGDPAAHSSQTVDSLEAVPREGELTLVPRADGMEFNPPARRFKWIESVHREEFRLRAPAGQEPGVRRGRLSVFLGSIILAEIPLTLKIAAAARADDGGIARESARPYRRIFASYSHLDHHIVEEFTEYARAIGDRYLRDVIDLRAGERWEPALERLIVQADVFQLFWSWNALASPHVGREWQYALGLQRPSFVRPVYWDEPMPSHGDLPPAALRALHFERIRPRRAQAPGPASAGGSPQREPPPSLTRPAAPGSPSPVAPGAPSRSPDAPSALPGAATPPAVWRRWRVLGPAMAAGLLLAVALPIWIASSGGREATTPPDNPPASVTPPEPAPPEPTPTERPRVAITVRVSRAADAQPVGGARVELVDARTGATAAGTSDASGSVALSAAPGDYRASVSIDGRVVLTRDLQVERSQTIDLELSDGAP